MTLRMLLSAQRRVLCSVQGAYVTHNAPLPLDLRSRDMTCPFPHTTRDQVWLAVGAAMGAVGYMAYSHRSAPAPGAAGKPGYLLVQIDPKAGSAAERSFAEYKRGVAPLIARHGGKYCVRGGKAEMLEGEPVSSHTVLIRFPSCSAALAFQNSPSYAALKKQRIDACESRAHLTLLEGLSSDV